MGKATRTRNIVLVGDLVASRRIIERSAVQGKLRACLRQLNSKKREGLVSPDRITLGDKFRQFSVRPTVD